MKFRDIPSRFPRRAGLRLGCVLAGGLLASLVAARVAPAAIAQKVPVPAQAAAVARPPAKPPIFALNSQDATISIIDPVSFQEVRRVPTGKEPHHLYLTPDERSLMVANALADSITLLDPKTGRVQGVVQGVADPYQLRFSPDMTWFVTAANRLDHVDIYRAIPRPGGINLRLIRRVPTGRTPSHITIDSRSTVAYVSMQDSDELAAIDLATQQVRWKVPVGKMPADVHLSPDDRQLFVALTGDRFVEVYDLAKPRPVLAARIRTADGAHAFRAWGDRRHVLVSNRAGNTISKIDMQDLKVVATYTAPGRPDCMDLTADRKTILVTSRWARKLTFIDTASKTVIRQVPIGRSPHGVWTLDHAPRE